MPGLVDAHGVPDPAAVRELKSVPVTQDRTVHDLHPGARAGDLVFAAHRGQLRAAIVTGPGREAKSVALDMGDVELDAYPRELLYKARHVRDSSFWKMPVGTLLGRGIEGARNVRDEVGTAVRGNLDDGKRMHDDDVGKYGRMGALTEGLHNVRDAIIPPSDEREHESHMRRRRKQDEHMERRRTEADPDDEINLTEDGRASAVRRKLRPIADDGAHTQSDTAREVLAHMDSTQDGDKADSAHRAFVTNGRRLSTGSPVGKVLDHEQRAKVHARRVSRDTPRNTAGRSLMTNPGASYFATF